MLFYKDFLSWLVLGFAISCSVSQKSTFTGTSKKLVSAAKPTAMPESDLQVNPPVSENSQPQPSPTPAPLAPTATLKTSAGSATSQNPIPVNLKFSTVVTGFTKEDILVDNGQVSSVSGSGSLYAFEVVPNGPGEVKIRIAANAVTDVVGTGSSPSNELVVVYDSSRPSVVLTSTAKELTNISPVSVIAKFSHSVIDFNSQDLIVENGNVSNFQGTERDYSFDIIPTKAGPVSVYVPENAAVSALDTGNTASAKLTRLFDNVRPTTTITSTLAGNVTNVASIPVQVAFSKPVSGFDAADISIKNAVLVSNIVSNDKGDTYTFSIVVTESGIAEVLVKDEAAKDSYGNTSKSAEFKSNYDGSRPTVTLTSPVAEATTNKTIVVTATFSEAISGFASNDIVVSNGKIDSIFPATVGRAYTFVVTPEANGKVSVQIPANSVQDEATNGNLASNLLTTTFDSVGPTVTLSSSVGSATNNSSIPLTIKFNEEPIGFDASDISVVGGVVKSGSVVADASKTTWTAIVSPNVQGNISISIAANKITDVLGNQNSASNVIGIVFDNVRPTAQLNSTAKGLVNLPSIPMTLTFSEEVTGFDLNDIQVTNGTPSNVNGSGKSYTFSVAPAAVGAVVIAVVDGAAVDAAGNTTQAASYSVTFDNSNPSATLATSSANPTNVRTFPVTITFSKEVSGLLASEVQVTNGSAAAFAGSGKNYTLSVTAANDGEVTVQVPANVAQDNASNGNNVSNKLSVLFDSKGPTVSISSPEASPTSKNPITISIVLNEPVTGFEISDITVTNGTLKNLTGSGVNYSAQLTAYAVGIMNVSIGAGTFSDVLGNPNQASNTFSIEYKATQYLADKLVKSANTENSVWMVTTGGSVYKVLLDKNAGYPTQVWTGVDDSGHRTFLSPIGLLIGKTTLPNSSGSAKLFRAGPDVPVTGKAELLLDLAVAGNSNLIKAPLSDTRVCPTAFKADGVEYIGFGYTTFDVRQTFVRIPVDRTKRGQIDLSRIKSFDIGSGWWGYSCYTDQAKKIYWSKAQSTGNSISGINLATGAPVSVTAAPNYAHKNLNIDGLQFDLSNTTEVQCDGGVTSQQSYALSGGKSWLFSVSCGYTSAYDPVSDTVFITNYARPGDFVVRVVKRVCFTEKANCVKAVDWWRYDLRTQAGIDAGSFGPISALPDGRIVATAMPYGQIFVLQLANPANPGAGINLEKIKDSPSQNWQNDNPYMYADFTGSQTYAPTQKATFDLRQVAGFQPEVTVKEIFWKWSAQSGQPEPWNALILSVRCYKAGETAPNWRRVNAVPTAGTELNISAYGCTGNIDTLETQIEADSASELDYSRTKDFSVRFGQ